VPLRLDLLRHGEASPAGAGSDDSRRLSEAGRAAIARLAERFASERWRPTALWSSPLVRAQETAAILVAGACPELPIGTLEALSPGCEPEDVVAELGRHAPRGHVVLVGHQPLLGRLVGFWAGGAEAGLPAGGLIRVEFEDPLRRGAATVTLEIRPVRS